MRDIRFSVFFLLPKCPSCATKERQRWSTGGESWRTKLLWISDCVRSAARSSHTMRFDDDVLREKKCFDAAFYACLHPSANIQRSMRIFFCGKPKPRPKHKAQPKTGSEPLSIGFSNRKAELGAKLSKNGCCVDGGAPAGLSGPEKSESWCLPSTN